MAGQPGYRCSVFVERYGTADAIVLLRAHRWSVDWKVDDLDSSTFINWGLGQYTPGVTDFNLAFDCLWFQADNPHQRNTNCIVAGAALSVKLRFAPAANILTPNTMPSALNDVPGYFFSRCLCTHVHTETHTRDLIRFNFAVRVSTELESDATELEFPGMAANLDWEDYAFYRDPS